MKNSYSKKILYLLISFTLLFSALSFTKDSIVTAQKNSILYSATTIYNLDKEGGKLKKKDLWKNTKVVFENYDITKDTIHLEGYVKTKNEKKEFNITGNLYKTHNTSKRIIAGDLFDKKGNFKVIHFAIDQDPKTKSFYFEKPSEGTNIKLYLLDESTRDFTFVESANKNLIKYSPYKENINNSDLPQVDTKEILWYGKFLAPIKVERKKSDNFSISSVDTDSDEVYYSATYDIMGTTVNEIMFVGTNLQCPTLLNDVNSQGTCYAKLEITKENTVSSTGVYDEEDSHFELGDNGPTVFQFRTENNGDGIQATEWSATYYKESNIDIQFDFFTYSPKKFPIVTFDLDYEKAGTVSENEELSVYPNDEDKSEFTGAIKTALPEGKILKDTNHEFNIVVDVGYFTDPDSSGDFVAKFSYRVSNVYDYYDEEDSQTLNISYTNQ